MKNTFKVNKPYTSAIKPPSMMHIKIMQQNGWCKNGFYNADEDKWYLVIKNETTEIEKQNIYTWWITE